MWEGVKVSQGNSVTLKVNGTVLTTNFSLLHVSIKCNATLTVHLLQKLKNLLHAMNLISKSYIRRYLQLKSQPYYNMDHNMDMMIKMEQCLPEPCTYHQFQTISCSILSMLHAVHGLIFIHKLFLPISKTFPLISCDNDMLPMFG